MEKGQFGIRISFYTVLAFILAYLGYSTALFLVAGIVIFVEKNEWAGRQVIQAICLCFIDNIYNVIINIFSPLRMLPFLGTAWNVTTGYASSAISILVFVFCVVGILNNLNGKDASIVGASRFAAWAYDKVSAN